MLHPEVAEFAGLLQQISELLNKNGHVFWAATIDDCRKLVEKSDFRGVSKFLGLFGGMGSLNDLQLRNDQLVLIEEDKQLERLRGAAWRTAEQFRVERKE